MKEKDIITNLSKKPKDMSMMPKLSGSNNYKALINKIKDSIRCKGQNVSLSQVKKEYSNVDFNNPEFYQILANSTKVHFNPESEMFELKCKYPIKNLEDLKNLIKSKENGIPIDSELEDSYRNIKNDIEVLKLEKSLRIIHNEDKKLDVMFYRDIEDPLEKYIQNADFKDALNEIRNVWKNELKYHERNDNNVSVYKEREPRLLQKKKKKFAKSKISNNHLLDLEK